MFTASENNVRYKYYTKPIFAGHCQGTHKTFHLQVLVFTLQAALSVIF